jgi:hypothetical protein
MSPPVDSSGGGTAVAGERLSRVHNHQDMINNGREWTFALGEYCYKSLYKTGQPLQGHDDTIMFLRHAGQGMVGSQNRKRVF